MELWIHLPTLDTTKDLAAKAKESTKGIREKATESTKDIREKAADKLPDKNQSKEYAEKTASFLKDVGSKTFSATKSTASKMKELIEMQRDKKQYEKSTEKMHNQSKTPFEKKEDVRTLPGKVTFLGRFFAKIGKIFSKITLWFASAVLGKRFGRMKSGIFKRYKDAIVTKMVLIFGGFLSLIVGFKMAKGYIKNRKHRKRDTEIEDLKNELRRMKDDIDEELRQHRESRLSSKSPKP